MDFLIIVYPNSFSKGILFFCFPFNLVKTFRVCSYGHTDHIVPVLNKFSSVINSPCHFTSTRSAPVLRVVSDLLFEPSLVILGSQQQQCKVPSPDGNTASHTCFKLKYKLQYNSTVFKENISKDTPKHCRTCIRLVYGKNQR